MDNDFYADDHDMGSRCVGAEQTTNQVASKLYKDGYRIGKAKAEETLMQEGFDIGFHRGVMIGRACGELYGACRIASSTNEVTLDAMKEIERLLFDELAHMDRDIEQTWMDELRNAVLAIAVDLVPKFQLFMQHMEEVQHATTTAAKTS